jgi:hypothetical protein
VAIKTARLEKLPEEVDAGAIKSSKSEIQESAGATVGDIVTIS